MPELSGSFIWVDDQLDFRNRVVAVTSEPRMAAIGSFEPLLADGKDKLREIIADVEAKKYAAPRFIILDIDLEDETYSGIEALREIRTTEALNHCPVVMHSRHLEEQNVLRSYELQANSVVQKPGTVAEQKKTIFDLIRYWSTLNLLAN